MFQGCKYSIQQIFLRPWYTQSIVVFVEGNRKLSNKLSLGTKSKQLNGNLKASAHLAIMPQLKIKIEEKETNMNDETKQNKMSSAEWDEAAE